MAATLRPFHALGEHAREGRPCGTSNCSDRPAAVLLSVDEAHLRKVRFKINAEWHSVMKEVAARIRADGTAPIREGVKVVGDAGLEPATLSV